MNAALEAAGHAEIFCFTGNQLHIENLLDDKHFELIRHDVTLPRYVEVDEIFNRQSGLTDLLLAYVNHVGRGPRLGVNVREDLRTMLALGKFSERLGVGYGTRREFQQGLCVYRK